MDTASNLVFELVFIRALSLAHFSSSFFKGSIQTIPYICPWELIYADDLIISAESMSVEELLVKLKTLKSEMAKRGLICE